VLDIHRRTGYLLLAVLLGQIILISAQVSTASGTRVIEAVTFGVLSQVQLAAARVFGGARSIWRGYFDLRGTQQENQRLKEELSAVQIRLQEQRALALRGAELEKLLALQQRTRLKTIAANVIARASSDIFRTVTIDRGATGGLRKDMAVLAPAGVVGRIVRDPAPNAASVQLLIDPQAGAGAMIERSGAGGVVVGADGDPPLRMGYVSTLADVTVGDRVLTSGIDGIFPRGFPIGEVAHVGRSTGLYKEVHVRPAVDFSTLGSVLIVLDPPPAATEGAP
jgi:rod shape-determining protein MreC